MPKHGVGVLLWALAAGGLQCSAHDTLRTSSSPPSFHSLLVYILILHFNTFCLPSPGVCMNIAVPEP